MIRQKDLDLLADLAKLLKKYGPESFESLRRLLTSGELPEEIGSILASSKHLAEEKPRPLEIRHPRPSRRSESLSLRQLSFLKISDPAKYDILERFYNQATLRRILPTRRDALDIAAELGLDVPKKATRTAVINKITLRLAYFPTEKLQSRIKEIIGRGKRTQTLEDWADLILGQRGRPEST